MINCGRPTKGQRENLPCLPNYNRNSTDLGGSDQLDTDLGAHNQSIVKRVTNGHVVVIGHHARRRHSKPPNRRTKHICIAQAMKEMCPFWLRRSVSILGIVTVT